MMTRQPRDSCSRVRAANTKASVYAFPARMVYMLTFATLFSDVVDLEEVLAFAFLPSSADWLGQENLWHNLYLFEAYLNPGITTDSLLESKTGLLISYAHTLRGFGMNV